MAAMKKKLQLEAVTAYRVHSSDDEMRSSDKGLYLHLGEAEKAAKGSGWYGSDGAVKTVTVYRDADGVVYLLEKFGKFTEIAEEEKKKNKESILAKLSAEELKLIKFKE